MNKTTERRTVLTSNGERNYSVEYIEEYFPIVRVSELSLNDEFLEHNPETQAQEKFKARLISIIKSGLEDFRAQCMDPSLDNQGKIHFQAGMEPAYGWSPKWWKENAEKFMPEKKSRLGTTNERIAFLGLLIKYLVEENGYTICDAWKAVCDQSKELGHYYDSPELVYGKHTWQETGSKQVGEWYDLANFSKITIDDENGVFSSVGGNYACYQKKSSLTHIHDLPCDIAFFNGVGWIVLSV